MSVRHYPIKPDDTMWVFNCDPSELERAQADPTAWHKMNICPNVPNCKTLDRHTVRGPYNPSHKKFQLTGICDTIPITARGYHRHIFRLFLYRNELIELRRRQGIERIPDLAQIEQYAISRYSDSSEKKDPFKGDKFLNTFTDQFWKDLDEELLRQNAKNEIEVFILEDEGLAYVHFEIGSDWLLQWVYAGAVSYDPSKHLAWLKKRPSGGAGKSVPRRAFKLGAANNKEEIDFDKVSFKLPSPNAALTPEIDVAMRCKAGCTPSACNIDSGIVEGTYTIIIDDVLIKGYCRAADGTPCPL